MAFSDRWTIRVPADSTDVVGLLRRAATYIESLGPVVVDIVVMDREAGDLVLTAVFDHHQLPTDLEYFDPRFAADFDSGRDERDDFDFMVALAHEVGAKTIVDLGCGTGMLAVELAAGGRRVFGVDPAPAMIAVARAREGGESVEWIIGTAAEIPSSDVDLVVMTGNISGYILDDRQWSATLVRIHQTLGPDGRLAFSSRNPEDRAWERWGGGAFLADGRVQWPDNDRFRDRVHADVNDSSLAYGDEVLVCDSEYRIRTLDELRDSLTHAGFEVEHLYGGWDRRSLDNAGPDLVVVARRS